MQRKADSDFNLDELSDDDDAEEEETGAPGYQFQGPDSNIKMLQSKIVKLELEIKTKQKVSKEASLLLDKENLMLKSLQDECRKCQEAVESLTAEVNSMPKIRVGKAAIKMSELETHQKELKDARNRVEHQVRIVEAERKIVLMTERELNNAERELHKLEEHREKANKHATGHLVQKIANTNVLKNLEKKGAKRIVLRQQVKKEHADRQNEEAFNTAVFQVQQAKANNKAAATRISGTSAIHKLVVEHAKQKEEDDYQQRTESVLQLKADLDTAMNQLKGVNEKLARRKMEEAQAHAAEEASLLSRGLNPYAEFRKRQVSAKGAREEKRQRDNIEQQEHELVERLVREDKYLRGQQQKEKEARAYEQKYRKELGRHVTEARTSEYLQSRTVGNKDIIDPSGKEFRIQASQVTTIKDATFGLGQNPRKEKSEARRVIDKIKSKRANQELDLGEFSRLVPKVPAHLREEKDENEGQTTQALPNEARRFSENLQVKALEELLLPDGTPVGAELQETLGLPMAEDEAEVDEDMQELLDAQGEEEEQEDTGSVQAPSGPRVLSKFELDARQRAQARQRERLEHGTVQVAGGRVFHGQAFVSNPEEIIFKDFDVDVPRNTKIVITNVSLTFNNFKVLDLPDSIKDFFEIKYNKPGRMSAGTTCPIEITFLPKLNEDIFSELKCLASTGPFLIPIKCTTKKVAPALQTHQVSFHSVVMGESQTFQLKIANNGARGTSYRFFLADRETTGGNAHPSLLPGSQGFSSLQSNELSLSKSFQEPSLHNYTVTNASPDEQQLLQNAASKAAADLCYKDGEGPFKIAAAGELGPYSEALHTITFAPLSAHFFRELYTISFEGFERRLELSVQGQGTELPIYVAEPIVDMKCCLYGKMYRTEVVVKNRGKIGMKIQANVPAELKTYLEFTPNMGYAQPSVDFILQMKFEPTLDILKAVGQFCLQEKGIIAVPIQIIVPDQVIPVYFTLRAQLTKGDVGLSQSAIDFGQCYITQSLVQSVRLKNLSLLPQKYGFIQCPQELEVQPNDGFGFLLPEEETEVLIYFKPMSAVTYNLTLTLKTSFSFTYFVKCKGLGLDPPFRISHTVLKLAPSCPGDRVIDSFFLKNTQQQSYVFEFFVPHPEVCCLKVIPTVDSLEPGQQIRIEVEFNPSMADVPSPNKEQAGRAVSRAVVNSAIQDEDSLDGKDGEEQEGQKIEAQKSQSKEDIKEIQGKIENFEGKLIYSCFTAEDSDSEELPEPWSRHATWKILCFLQKGLQSSKDAHVQPALPPLVVEVQTTTVQRLLSVDSNSIDFGQLAVGQSKIIPVKIRNFGDVPAPLTASGLNSTGAFSIVNALRPISPRSIFKMLIQFAPTSHGVRIELLKIISSVLGKTIVMNVRGEGVSPVLKLTPDDGIISMGHVLQNDTKRRSLTLTNTSLFPLTFEFKPLESGPQNYSHLACFAMIPAHGRIQPGQNMTVEVVFNPDHERIWPYHQRFLVDVPNQATAAIVYVSGRCWMRQMYCVSKDPQCDIFSRVPEAAEDVLALPWSFGSIKSDVASKLKLTPEGSQEIFLKFPKSSLEKASEVQSLLIDIGSTLQEELKVGGPGTFEIEVTPECKASGYFLITPDKGTVQPGKSQDVIVKFTPPPVSPDGGLDVGQWYRTVALVHMKGGFRPTGDSEVHSVKVHIEGYIRI